MNLNVLVLLWVAIINEIKCLEDDLHYAINWPGRVTDLEKSNLETLDLLTSNNEQFKCALPAEQPDADEISGNKNMNHNTLKTSSLLVGNIHAKKLCSYRIESYWIYELCHGQYLKQYHETKASGKRVITNEYFLGYYDKTKQEPEYIKQSEDKLVPNIHWKYLDGKNMPMFAMKYTDGTPCDIIGNVPRETTVYYACDETGNENIVSFEEISSCVYEMVVLTEWLCIHPAYRLPEKTHQTINCFSLDNTRQKPLLLTQLEKELYDARNDDNKLKMTDDKGDDYIVHYKTVDMGTAFHIEDIDELEAQNTKQNAFSANKQATFSSEKRPEQNVHNNDNELKMKEQQPAVHSTNTINENAQKEMINAFLSGQQCLNGGTGWWKYEICYKKHVIQYHEDERTKKRQNILLGTWNDMNHIEWMNKNPNKKPATNKNDRQTGSLYFSNGDICHEINRKRFVEVKLKCVRSKEKQYAISMYLIEPAMCEYLLVVESPWLCDLIESLDARTGLPNANPTGSKETVQKLHEQQQQQQQPQQNAHASTTTTQKPHTKSSQEDSDRRTP